LSSRYSVSIALLEKAGQLLSGFGAFTLLADRAFPCDELIAWFGGKPRWSYVMRLLGDTEIHGAAAALGRWRPDREPGDRPSHTGLHPQP
jgi:hypothetical protein